ncbi:unnamed protein product, partial [Sphagnum troendelagicum]
SSGGCSSKLSRSGACCCNAASSGAKKLRRLQQALTLRSLLHCSSKLRSQEAPEVAASSHAPELAALQQQAPEPRSSEAGQAPELAALQGLVAASKLRSREAPE